MSSLLLRNEDRITLARMYMRVTELIPYEDGRFDRFSEKMVDLIQAGLRAQWRSVEMDQAFVDEILDDAHSMGEAFEEEASVLRDIVNRATIRSLAFA
jgi:hypothetical protein